MASTGAFTETLLLYLDYPGQNLQAKKIIKVDKIQQHDILVLKHIREWHSG